MGLDIRYLAGFFDGEGSIFITKRASNNRPYRYIRLSACNTNHPIIRRIHRQFGGRLYLATKKAKPNWRPTLDWVLNGREAARLLMRLLPYLHVKKQEARRALKFHNMTIIRSPRWD